MQNEFWEIAYRRFMLSCAMDFFMFNKILFFWWIDKLYVSMAS